MIEYIFAKQAIDDLRRDIVSAFRDEADRLEQLHVDNRGTWKQGTTAERRLHGALQRIAVNIQIGSDQ